MAQADSSNNTRRRDFLALTAAAATVVMATRPALALSDPIHAAIGVHKAAYAAVKNAVDRNSAFEEELYDNTRLQRDRRLPDEQRRGAEIEEALNQAYNAELEAAIDLLGVNPTTWAGAAL